MNLYRAEACIESGAAVMGLLAIIICDTCRLIVRCLDLCQYAEALKKVLCQKTTTTNLPSLALNNLGTKNLIGSDYGRTWIEDR